MTTTVVPTSAMRLQPLRSAWRSAHDPVPGVPRWAQIAAIAVPFTVLPASVWRVTVVFASWGSADSPGKGDLPAWLPIELYVVALSLVSELLAFTAVGMVARWGEVFPRWLPFLGARRVPISFAVVPAVLASALLTMVTVAGAINNSRGLNIKGEPLPDNYPLHFRDAEGVISVAAYAPLLLWGPLLAAVTVAYWLRRRQDRR